MATYNWGLVIRRLREQKGLTQSELAGLAGVKRSVIAQYENGYVKTFDHAKLSRFASALGITSSELSAQLDASTVKKEWTINHQKAPQPFTM